MDIRNVLRIKIYQPSANYRVPFSYQRKFTYPIPPHSTIKGLICNLVGIPFNSGKSDEFRELKRISIAVFGEYESLTREYIWFRNMDSKSHIDRFNSDKSRTKDGVVQHPGGQMPTRIDTLNEVKLILYIYHKNPEFLNKIKEAFENPVNRNSVIHLGRAEDWLVFEDIRMLNKELEVQMVRSIPYFTWFPNKDYTLFPDYENYDKIYENLNGNIFRMPTIYQINEDNQRIFTEYIITKLCEHASFARGFQYLTDAEEKLPLLLCRLESDRGNEL